MKKILHTIETRGPGGAEILVLNIAKSLKSKAYENFGFFIKEGWIRKSFEEIGIKTISCSKSPTSDIKIVLKFIWFLRKNSIEIIHTHEFLMSFFASLVSLFLKVNVVSTFHGMNYHSDNSRRQRIMRFIANHSNLVVVSEEVKKYICGRCDIETDKITVIENGVFSPPRSDEEGTLKSELGIGKESILIGTVGRLHEVKGQIYLVKAAKKIIEKNKNVYFVIAGEGVERKKLENEIDRANISNNFKLLGNRDDVNNILNSIDIFILPSLSEGTSLALLEAMSHGLLVIASNVGGNSILIKSEENGILVEAKSEKAIEKALSNILKEPNKINGYKNNSEYVINNFSFDTMLDKYIGLFANK